MIGTAGNAAKSIHFDLFRQRDESLNAYQRHSHISSTTLLINPQGGHKSTTNLNKRLSSKGERFYSTTCSPSAESSTPEPRRYPQASPSRTRRPSRPRNAGRLSSAARTRSPSQCYRSSPAAARGPSSMRPVGARASTPTGTVLPRSAYVGGVCRISCDGSSCPRPCVGLRCNVGERRFLRRHQHWHRRKKGCQ